MINAIKEIGEYVQEKDFLTSLVKENDNIKYIVKVNFDTKKNEITIEKEESDKEKLIRYLWIGHFVSGSRSKKVYFVTSNFDNIKKIINDFAISEYSKEFKDITENIKKITPKLLEKIDDIQIDIDKKERAIFTISIDNKLLSDYNEYKDIIKKELIEKHFLKNFEGFCSICGEKNKKIISEVYVFKYYNIDKPGASSYLDGKFTSNFLVCEDCYAKSLVGKNFVEQYLDIKWGSNKFYIVPKLILKPKHFDIKKFVDLIKIKYNPAEDISKFTKKLKGFIKIEEDNKNSFVLNYLFYEQKNKSNPDSIAITKLIKDVLPSRFNKINNVLQEINHTVNLPFQSFYYLIGNPVKNIEDKKYFLEIIDTILKGEKINCKRLISNFVKASRFMFYNKVPTNLEKFIYRTNYFLLFLYKINSLKESKKMEENIYNEVIDLLDKQINWIKEKGNNPWAFIKLKDYIKEFKNILQEESLSLIILGYIISDISREQQKNLHNKPILNKINYDGMNINKIIKLSVSIFEKLVQYGLLYNNELSNYIKDKLFISRRTDWRLSNVENVYYILAGYSLGSVYTENNNNEEEQ